MRIKLVRKFANVINDIDLTRVAVGDVIDIEARQARMLLVEGWAEPVPPGSGPADDPPARSDSG
jgi:hypothetical protein